MTEHLRVFGRETFASLHVRNFRLFFVGQRQKIFHRDGFPSSRF